MPVFAQQKDAVDPQAVQQRDLLGVAKALEEFGELSLKVDEAFRKATPPLGRTFHGRRGFGGTGEDV